MCLPGWVDRPLARTSPVGVTGKAASTEPGPIQEFNSSKVDTAAVQPDRLPLHQLKERIYS